ncbi:MAG: type II toxin-antitoxin system VapC family toxin [Desulfotomaculaceae bacterium]|nr:type II toxin-antitoxin system VapC family toxin [Desulfotomaculaceae bacterium]
MTDLLLDTSVLIDHLRGYKPATDFFETVFNSGVPAIISSVSEMELYAGKSMENPSVEESTSNFLKLFRVLPVTSAIAQRAGYLLRLYRNNGLTPIDAIIAATALAQDANLITRNIKHFRPIKGLIVFDIPTDYD